jgi:hypothetical protein
MVLRWLDTALNRIMLACPACLLAQRLQLSVFDEGNRGYLQVAQLHRFLEAMVPTAPMLQCMEVRRGCLSLLTCTGQASMQL